MTLWDWPVSTASFHKKAVKMRGYGLLANDLFSFRA
jgi:hypothetical protein